MTQTGVYVGNDPAAFAAYSKWVGSAPDNVLNYLNNDNWKAFDSSIAYEVTLWKNTATPSIWSVPLSVWSTSLEQVATGAFNDHFLKAAQGLAQTKVSSDGNIYVRVGWEFNGSWMPWAAAGHETAFIQSFQNLVNTFRSVSDKFKFVWDTTNDGGNMNPEKAYPGDKYVDVIGTDVYYHTQWDGGNASKAFQGEVARAYGLQWQQDFAAAHGKATAISEWGVASNNAGSYIDAMTKWMADHNMVYENYWDSNADYSGKLSTGINANAGAIYRSAIANLDHSSPETPSAPPANPGSVSTPPMNTDTDTLVFKVSGDKWQGDPHFIVTVDGKQVGGVLTTSASHAAGQTQDITLTGNFGSSAHDVVVKFIDDAYGGSADKDRNLYVHQVSLNGQGQDGSGSTNNAGSNSNGAANLLGNGTATFHTGGDDTLVFKVSGDSWQGDPHFIVTVDGKQVGGTLTTSASHAEGQTQDITLTGNFGSGTHDVAVKFLDDAYGGWGYDRNLYVHQVTLDSEAHAGSVAAGSSGVAGLMSTGSTAVVHMTGGGDWHM
ncbi:hypothetical protein MKK70_19590 [Methylobacterium sp. E-041]|uniref:carbohydrate-binding domain-containing protein n=1 Tax=Methylobacterium sp. E-041 TaxID=2836573 RepID=UPI001FBA5EEB|nr:carbohydrate-binding domain-containing protein [Methylobacterium sp. E-041]MCJ2107539.1 hypothetical protein [Methylobacterium sp. E-041]